MSEHVVVTEILEFHGHGDCRRIEVQRFSNAREAHAAALDRCAEACVVKVTVAAVVRTLSRPT